MNMEVSKSSSLLINEPPLQVLPSLVCKLGNIHEAIMLQQLQYWLQRSPNEYNGRKWVFNTIKEWRQQFPWLSEKSIRTRFNSLKEKGIVITANFNKAKFDRTKWYSIDYDCLNKLLNNAEKNGDGEENSTHVEESSSRAEGSSARMEGSSTLDVEESSTLDAEGSSTPIPLDYQENTIDYTETNVTVSQIESDFKKLWNIYPKKVGEIQAFDSYKKWVSENPSEHTYLLMCSKLDRYLKYLKINDIAFRYVLNGNTWFAGRFNDKLDVPEGKNCRSTGKKVHKLVDWEKYAKEHPVKKNTDTSRKELQQEWKQTIRAIEGDDEKDIKENSNSSTSIQTSKFKDTENSDFTMNAEEAKQLYHDLGIDDLLE